MHAHTVTRCTIIMVVWPQDRVCAQAKLNGYSCEQALSRCVQMYSPLKCMLIENAVYMKSTLFTKSYFQKYFPLYFIVRVVIVYMYITLFTDI